MGYYNYLIVSLVNLPTKQRWEFRVLNANVEMLYGENFNKKLAFKWTKFLEEMEYEFGILNNDGNDEKIILSSDDIREEDFPKLARKLAGFWKRLEYEVSYMNENGK